jgi:hypothetical protein
MIDFASGPVRKLLILKGRVFVIGAKFFNLNDLVILQRLLDEMRRRSIRYAQDDESLSGRTQVQNRASDARGESPLWSPQMPSVTG